VLMSVASTLVLVLVTLGALDSAGTVTTDVVV